MKEEVYSHRSLEIGMACHTGLPEAPELVRRQRHGGHGFHGKERARQGEQARDWLVGIISASSGESGLSWSSATWPWVAFSIRAGLTLVLMRGLLTGVGPLSLGISSPWEGQQGPKMSKHQNTK